MVVRLCVCQANFLMRIEGRAKAARAGIVEAQTTFKALSLSLKEVVVKPKTGTADDVEAAGPPVSDEPAATHQQVLVARAALRKSRKAAGRAGSLLVNSGGVMRLRDEHLDVFSRYMFPIVYIAWLFWHNSTVPADGGATTNACPAQFNGSIYV